MSSATAPAPAFDPGFLWRLTTGDPEVCLAIVDGAVDLAHPCFAGATIETCAGTNAAPTRHGTQVASLVFGQHGSGVTGMAPRCRGLLVPVYTPGPDGTSLSASQLDLAQAITTAVERGAQVINISGGEIASSAAPERFLSDALTLCADRDVLVIGATGNGGCDCLEIPAAVPTVLAVGASDGEGEPLAFSNWGAAYRDHGVTCLGRDLTVALPGGGSARVSGTSFAAALVTGIAGLLLSVQRGLGQRPRPRLVRQALLDSARPCAIDHGDTCRRLLRGEVRPTYALGRVLADAEDAPAARGQLVPAGLETPDASDPLAGASTDAATEERPMSAVAQDTAGVNVPARPAGVTPSDCGCGGSGGAGCSCGGGARQESSLVYALASLGYDFCTWTRYEWYAQQMMQRLDPDTNRPYGSPLDRTAFLNYISKATEDLPGSLESVLWTLEFGNVPIYALAPAGPNAALVLQRIKTFFSEQVIGKYDLELKQWFRAERCSVPGVLTGRTATLLNGLVVPVMAVTDRGLYNWSVEWLIAEAVARVPPPLQYRAKEMLRQFFEKVYYQLRNLGRTPEERALNYSGTNVYQLVENIVMQRPQDITTTMIQDIRVEKTPICRPGSDCWDVVVTVFNPERVKEDPRIVTRVTIDVSDIVPVTVGPGLSWPEY